MTIRNSVALLAVAATTTLAGCALQARSDVDPRASVAVCHTYTFGDASKNRLEPAAAFANPLNEKRLRDAIESSLVARGLKSAPDDSADCAVGYAIGSRLAIDPTAPRFSWGLGAGWGHRGGMGGAMAWNSVPYDYREGRVVVDLFNARTREPLWHASVDQDVTQLTGAEAQKRINAAVTAIFATFPGSAAPAPKP